VAGPIFSRMAEKVARYLDLTPTEEVAPLAANQKKVVFREASRD